MPTSSQSPRAALYARISQKDADVPAVENQLANLRALAATEGYTIVGEYKDDGLSGYSGIERPDWLRLLDGLGRGEFDVVLAVAEDRFTRRSEEKTAFLASSARAGVTWHTLAGGKVDPGTAHGGLIGTVTGALAEYESHVRAERIRRSVADRLAQGKDLGGPRPFGWEVDRLTERKVEADLLRDAYEAVLNGKSLKSIAAAWNASGVRRDRAKGNADTSPGWRPQTVRNALLRERNCGRLVVKGVAYADDRPKIVEPETFEAVKAILENPARAPKRGPVGRWTASGTVRCAACGSYLSLVYNKSRKKSGVESVPTLRCSPDSRPMNKRGPGHAYMRAAALEAELSRHVETEVLLRTSEPGSLSVGPVGIPALRVRIAQLTAERDHVQAVAMLPGANLAMAGKRLAELAVEVEQTQADLDERLAADVASRALEVAGQVLRGIPDDDDNYISWADFWGDLPVEERRELVRAVLPNPRLLPAASAWGNGWRVTYEPFSDTDTRGTPGTD
jgi:site-specific DNA recombinase